MALVEGVKCPPFRVQLLAHFVCSTPYVCINLSVNSVYTLMYSKNQVFSTEVSDLGLIYMFAPPKGRKKYLAYPLVVGLRPNQYSKSKSICPPVNQGPEWKSPSALLEQDRVFIFDFHDSQANVSVLNNKNFLLATGVERICSLCC